MILDELIPHLQKAVDDNCLFVQLPTYFVEQILEKLKEQEKKTGKEYCDGDERADGD